MGGLYCTTFGCTIHDYPVAPQYCTYQYDMQRQRDSSDEIIRMLGVISASMTPGTAASPQPVPASRPAQKPTQRRSGGGGVPL